MKRRIIKFLVMLFTIISFMQIRNNSCNVYAAEVIPSPENVRITIDEYGYTILNFEMPEFEYMGTLEYYIQYDTDGEFEEDCLGTWFYNTSGDIYLNMAQEYSIRVQAVLYDIEGWEIGRSDWSEIYQYTWLYEPVKSVKVSTVNMTTLRIKWERAYEGDYYRIYRSMSEDGDYILLGETYNKDETSWDDAGLKAGKTYYYKVCVYDEWEGIEGEWSEAASGIPRPASRSLTAKPASSTSVRLTWTKGGTSIAGYEIYRSKSKNSGYKRIKIIGDRTTTSFVNKNLTNGTTYYYKIRSYAVVDGENVYGLYCKPREVKVTIGVPEIESIKLAGINKAKITYTKIPGITGYLIYRSTSKNGTYKKIKTIKDKNTTSYTATGLTNGKTYYFKVRAYKKTDDKTSYSGYSDIKSRLMNKLGYAGEYYEDKCKRIFGKYYYAEYQSEKAASKNMKEIKIKTWDINSKGKKYTRYHYLTVHKNIAGTVQQIFKEIYNGDEKFPIKDVGGYSWRGENSSSEHCEGVAIDINYNENAQFDGNTGKPKVGTLYKPGKNPYSIPEDGDVVKTFEKYGFYWGDRFYNPDYMHFSYFGG